MQACRKESKSGEAHDAGIWGHKMLRVFHYLVELFLLYFLLKLYSYLAKYVRNHQYFVDGRVIFFQLILYDS